MSRSLRIFDETRIPLEDARALLGTSDSPASMATVRRATHVGARTPDGGRTCLEFLQIGGKHFTSTEAIERYVAAINGISLDAEATTAPAKRRMREVERARRELDAAGI